MKDVAPIGAATAFVRAHLPPARRRAGLALLEGWTLAETALAGSWPVEAILLAEGADPARRARLLGSASPPNRTEPLLLTRAAMARLSDVQEAPDVGVLLRVPTPPPIDPARPPARLLVLDRVSDPGNAGTMIRAAAAFGFRVALTPGCVAPGNEKLLRASAGYATRAGLLGRLDGLPPWHSGADAVLALMPGAGEAPEDVAARPVRSLALVVGNESSGLDPGHWPEAQPLRLPMPGGTESLNAAVAASIAMYILRVAGNHRDG